MVYEMSTYHNMLVHVLSFEKVHLPEWYFTTSEERELISLLVTNFTCYQHSPNVSISMGVVPGLTLK